MNVMYVSSVEDHLIPASPMHTVELKEGFCISNILFLTASLERTECWDNHGFFCLVSCVHSPTGGNSTKMPASFLGMEKKDLSLLSPLSSLGGARVILS